MERHTHRYYGEVSDFPTSVAPEPRRYHYTFGTDEDDTLVGIRGKDIIKGGIGNDDIRGLAARDWLFGEGGRDTLNGGLGNDTLYGGHGKDTLFLFLGHDVALGGAGEDKFVIRGGGEIVQFSKEDKIGFDNHTYHWDELQQFFAGTDEFDRPQLSFAKGSTEYLITLSGHLDFEFDTSGAHAAHYDTLI